MPESSPRNKDSFTSEVLHAISHATIVNEKGAREAWVKNIGGIPNAYEHWLKMQEFDEGFSFDTPEGLHIVPMRIALFQRDVRSSLKRILRIGSNREESDLIFTRNFNGNGRDWEEVAQVHSGHEAVFITASDGALSREQVESLYPQSPKRKEGNAWIVRLIQSTNQRIKKNAHIEDPLFVSSFPEGAPDSSIEQTIRDCEAIITQHGGKIVFRLSPEKADRVLIALKYYHGNEGTFSRYDAYDPLLSDVFLRHRQNLVDVSTSMYRVHEKGKTKFFWETYPISFAYDRVQAENEYKMLHDMYADIHHQTQRMAQMRYQYEDEARAAGIDIDDLRRIHSSAVTSYGAAVFLDTGMGPQNVFGDGRLDNKVERNVLETQISEKRSKLYRGGYGQIGFANAKIDVEKERESLMFNDPQRTVVKNIAENLTKNDVGILVYGAAHFSSGDRSKISPEIDKTFEDYIQYLPNTYIIVVDEQHLTRLHENHENTLLLLRKLSREERTMYSDTIKKIEQTLTHIYAYLMVIYQSADNEIKRKFVWLKLAELFISLRELKGIYGDICKKHGLGVS